MAARAGRRACARAASVSLRRVVAARRGQQRVARAGCLRPPGAGRARPGSRRRSSRRRAAGGRWTARRRARRRRARGRSRAAPARRTTSRGIEVGARAQVLEERAAQVLLDLLARLLDRDLGQAGDRGDVQELERLRRRLGVAGQQQHRADELVAARDRRLARRRRPARSPGGRGRGRRRSGAASSSGPSPPPATRRGPEPRDDDRDRRARRAAAASCATRSRPSPCSTASTISQVQLAQPGDERRAR